MARRTKQLNNILAACNGGKLGRLVARIVGKHGWRTIGETTAAFGIGQRALPDLMLGQLRVAETCAAIERVTGREVTIR